MSSPTKRPALESACMPQKMYASESAGFPLRENDSHLFRKAYQLFEIERHQPQMQILNAKPVQQNFMFSPITATAARANTSIISTAAATTVTTTMMTTASSTTTPN